MPAHHLHTHFAEIESYPFIALLATHKETQLLLVNSFEDI